MDWAPACQRQLAQGRDLDAFITFVRGINPQTTGRAPRWLLRLLLPLLIKKPERQQKYSLLPTTIREHAEEARLDNTYAHYQEIAADILVMTGGQAGVTAQAVPTLAAALPQARIAHFPTLDHFGPEKKPKEIAECLTRFLLAPERESVGGGARRNKLAPSGPSRRT